ncbi:MAG: TolC family protein [Oligoflexia bacterium]|nr:TolC family protein [Oligoflexia bacterium]
MKTSYYFAVSLASLRLLYCLTVFFLPVVAWADDPAPPYSLEECYQLALQNSESLKISEEDLSIADAQYRQAMAALLPNIDLLGSQRFRDNANFGRIMRGSSFAEDNGGSTGGSGGGLGRSQSEITLGLSQPIFHGFRDYLLLRAAQGDYSAQELDLSRSRELLYQDVAALFYEIQLHLAEVAVYEAGRTTLNARLKELGEFEKLGKARESETLASRAELADLEASREAAQGQARTSLELMAFLTGISADQLSLEGTKLTPELNPLAQYLERVQARADLQAAAVRIEAEKQRSQAISRERWPGLDLTADAYPFEDPDRTRDWEAGLTLSMPIFDGGMISARESEARALVKKTQLSAQQKRRLAERDVRVSYADSAAGFAEYKSLQKLVSSAKKNYEVQTRDYGLGIVTNLDVLQAIRTKQDAERRLELSRYSYLAALTKLEVSAGGVVK